MSANTRLTLLSCGMNQLESLYPSANTALTYLSCYSNQLTSLDISRNTALEYLYCDNNPGDGISTFPVTAWFDNQSRPGALYVYRSGWEYDGKTITIDFREAE